MINFARLASHWAGFTQTKEYQQALEEFYRKQDEGREREFEERVKCVLVKYGVIGKDEQPSKKEHD